MLKFQELLKNKDDYNKDKANISMQDIKKAEKIVIKHAQEKYYGKELKKLSQGEPVNRSSSLVSLNPVMDDEGIIHIGGRLRHAKLNNDVRQKEAHNTASEQNGC